jgi:ankyrin repeat protein
LDDLADLGKIMKVSVAKKANTNKDITPLHCACINPNPKYIKLLLDANPDLNLTDNEMRKPVHYAAACVGPEPLKVLI